MLLLYNIKLSNCTIVGIRPDFKGSPAGLGLCTWQWKHTPQGRVETRTFFVGGLHYSNTGVPYNGRPWPTSVHLYVCACVRVCDSVHILAHMYTQGSSIIHNRSHAFFFLIYGLFADVKSYLALWNLAAICNTELNMRRQTFAAPK